MFNWEVKQDGKTNSTFTFASNECLVTGTYDILIFYFLCVHLDYLGAT